jgi:predicted Zn-ribbon and HTH transcriptional regulator
LTCKRCGHEWMPRMKDVRICPKCKTARWDQARKTGTSR